MISGSESISEKSFFDKVAGVPKQAGCAVIRAAVTLWVLLGRSEVPVWAKASIVSALLYFISFLDFYPDFLPFGFADDFSVMALLIGELGMFLDENAMKEIEELLPRHCQK